MSQNVESNSAQLLLDLANEDIEWCSAGLTARHHGRLRLRQNSFRLQLLRLQQKRWNKTFQ